MSSLPPALPMLLAALLLPLLRGKLRVAVALAAPLASLALLWTLPLGPVLVVDYLEAHLAPVSLSATGRVFGTVFAIMAFTGTLYALHRPRPVELPAALLYAGSAIGVTCAGDWLTLFVFWELMAVGSTVVVWCGDGCGAARAGLRYAAVHFLGGVVLMSGILLHLQAGGTITVGPIPLDGPAAWLMVIGMLVNAGAPPLGSWLPDAYPEASESGAVFLSAFTTKTAVYALMVTFAGERFLMLVGVVMALYGIVYAILENDMRRILSYSIINQVGFMVCGIGIGTDLALDGAAAHAFAHIIYKALLLMSAGSVLHMTGVRKCTELGGLYRTMPITMWCGIIGALAISAFPLTSGFVTKSMITAAAAEQHIAWVWILLAAASAGVFLHAGIKFPWFVFFQRDSGLRPPEPPGNMRAAMLFFAALCILIGVVPGPLHGILPHPEAAAEFHSYTFSHVLSQLQLLLFAGLAFFALLPLLRRTRTITLEFDWFYRRLAPLIWSNFLAPLCRAAGRLEAAFVARGGRLLGRDIHLPAEHHLLEDWPVGKAVILITLVLLAYLLVHLRLAT